MYLLIALLVMAGKGYGSNPIQCTTGKGRSCTLSNYQGLWTDRQPCVVANVAYPTTEKELISAVAGAVERKQSIKVVSKLAHSLPKLACPRGSSGLLISTSKYVNNIIIHKRAKTVTVDAGVELRDLFQKLARHGLTFPCAPSFNGISVAGAISTGAHGASGIQGKGGAVHEYVVGISIVVPAKKEEGYAKVIKLTSSDEELNAAKLSIGVLGAISQVTFSVQPMFKRSVVKIAKNESSLVEDIFNIAQNYDFGDINWHISQGKTILTVSNKVPANTPGDGRNINYTPRLGSSVKYWRGVGEEIMASGNASMVCAASATSVVNRVSGGDGYVNEGNKFVGYPVVGFNNLMETGGGCQNTSFTETGDKLTCPWDSDLPGQIFFENSVAIPFGKIKEAIHDIQKLRDRNPDKLCGINLYGGAIMRFVKGSTAYLANPDDAVYLDMLFFRDRRSNTPRFDEDGMEEVQQMLLKKYNARPHWGKNTDFAFENIGGKVTCLEKFLKVKEEMDPEGLFSSEWSDAVLGIRRKGTRRVSIMTAHCALEGLCVCSRHKHCAPEKGFYCKRGSFFKDARVCRLTVPS